MPRLLIFVFLLCLASCNRKLPHALPTTTTPPELTQPTAAAASLSSAPARVPPPKATPVASAAPKPTPPITPPISIVPEDPSELAKIQSRFLATINEAIAKADPGLRIPRTTFAADGSHTVILAYAGTFTYDIKRSDSIISPLEGTVSWAVRWYHNGVAANIPMSLDARYDFQNGQWIIKDLVRKVNNDGTFPAQEYLHFFQ